MDPDTLPEEQSKIFEFDDRQFDLVFSDEFNRYVLIQYVRLRCVALDEGKSSYIITESKLRLLVRHTNSNSHRNCNLNMLTKFKHRMMRLM